MTRTFHRNKEDNLHALRAPKPMKMGLDIRYVVFPF